MGSSDYKEKITKHWIIQPCDGITASHPAGYTILLVDLSGNWVNFRPCGLPVAQTQLHLYVFCLTFILVLSLLSQSSQNQSFVSPSPTSTQQPATSSSAVSPTQLTGPNVNRPVTRPKEFKGRFTITNMSWKPEYANVKSSEYSNLKASLERELNNTLENAIPGFVMCVAQWFNKGSVIAHFVIYVSGNQELTSEKLQMLLLGAWSSGSLTNFSLENITVEKEQIQNEQTTEETKTFLRWELWKIISLGGLLIVFILLVFILGLLVSTNPLFYFQHYDMGAIFN